MKTFQDFDIDDAKVRMEERRSLLPKGFRRVQNVKRITRVSPAWPGVIVATILFAWWTWFVVSDVVRPPSKRPGIGVDGERYYGFDEVWVLFIFFFSMSFG